MPWQSHDVNSFAGYAAENLQDDWKDSHCELWLAFDDTAVTASQSVHQEAP